VDKHDSTLSGHCQALAIAGLGAKDVMGYCLMAFDRFWCDYFFGIFDFSKTGNKKGNNHCPQFFWMVVFLFSVYCLFFTVLTPFYHCLNSYRLRISIGMSFFLHKLLYS